MNPDEAKCRQKLKAKRGETTLEALERFMKRHKKVVAMLTALRVKARGTAWHGCNTIQRVACRAGVCHSTVTDDIAREMITPDRKEKIDGKMCHVFTESEVKSYVTYRATLTGRGKLSRSRKIIRSANTVGLNETARLFDMKPSSVRKVLERHKVKLIPLEDIQAAAKTVHRVAV